MSNETFKTNHGNVPKLTDQNNPVWKQKICQDLIAKKAYNIVTSVELLPVGKHVTLLPLQTNSHDHANREIARIILGCCNELLPLIDDIDDPVEMRETPRDQLDNASTKLGRPQVRRKFTTYERSRDKTVTQYLTKPTAFRMQLLGTTENITNDAKKTHMFTTLSNSYEMTIQILEQCISAPTAKQCMDVIGEYAKWTTLIKDIGEASARAALYICGGNRGHRGWSDGRAAGRGNTRQEHSCP